jgi:hypothetical protein
MSFSPIKMYLVVINKVLEGQMIFFFIFWVKKSWDLGFWGKKNVDPNLLGTKVTQLSKIVASGWCTTCLVRWYVVHFIFLKNHLHLKKYADLTFHTQTYMDFLILDKAHMSILLAQTHLILFLIVIKFLFDYSFLYFTVRFYLNKFIKIIFK